VVRTIISLEPETKQWLDRKAAREGVPMSRLVRRAVSEFRRRADGETVPVERLLARTKGIWKRGDGLSYQRAMRREWDRLAALGVITRGSGKALRPFKPLAYFDASALARRGIT